MVGEGTETRRHGGTKAEKRDNVRIGVVLPQDRMKRLRIEIPGADYTLNGTRVRGAALDAGVDGDGIAIGTGKSGHWMLEPVTQNDAGGITLRGCRIGRGFHWESRIDLVLPGRVELSVVDGHLLVVNELSVETYLKGVITAEMSGGCPVEFAKAQCIVARSWLYATSERKHEDVGVDFCHDDCCQRYQGVGALTPTARAAVEETGGQVLVHENGGVVDANYHKSCGGIVEAPEAVWGEPKAGQHSVVDAPADSRVRAFYPVGQERIANYVSGRWLTTCSAYCGPRMVPDADLPNYLGRVDDGGGHFRWSIAYTPKQLARILTTKLLGELGEIHDLVVTRRGCSGRALSLDVVYDDGAGVRRTVTVEGQHAIRDALSESFLYSSAFDVRWDRNAGTVTLVGAGWGHGAGMCQIGALGMALAGYDHERILMHYFKDVTIR